MSTKRKIVLFETERRHTELLPLSFTRPVADFRLGILTIREKWERLIEGSYSYLPVEYLRSKFTADDEGEADVLYINGAFVPDMALATEVCSLQPGQALVKGDETVAYRGERHGFELPADAERIELGVEAEEIRYVFDVFLKNAAAIDFDFSLLTAGRKSCPLSATNTVIGDHRLDDGRPAIFVEEGATVECATLNVTEGPIYIGRDAQVMEGSHLRGPIALCHRAKVNMGTKIYGATTLGPYSKVGGELNNVVIFGYSNKAHDGFLGNAVIGEWCNIGAGANASNLKNDYSKIRIWNYYEHTFMRTDLQFCGLIMGDHSKAGINTMFNTACVVGVGVNIHGCGFPRVFIPSFSEGSPASGFTDVSLKKFFDIASRVMARRDIELTDLDRDIFQRVFEVAAGYKH